MSSRGKTAGVTSCLSTAAGICTYFSRMSASTITATLATIGFGSMAAGIGVVAVAPLVVGFGVKSLVNLFTD